MLLPCWLRKLKTAWTRPAVRRPRPSKGCRLQVELLEDRVTPSTVTWTGAGANDLWSNNANWDTLAAPVDNDDVIIPDVVGSAEVLFDSTVAGAGVTLRSLSSSEPFRITADTLTLSGAGVFSFTNQLTLAGGTLSGDGSVTASGNLNWSGGTMSGSGETRATGGLQISGINQKTLNQRLLTNTGAATWSGTGNIAGSNGSVISNEGTFDAQTPAQFFISGVGPAAFNNLGTFTKSVAGTTTSFNAGTFNNSGILDVQSGVLLLGGAGGSSTGSFAVDAGATLQFGGTTALASGAFSGAGTVQFTAGTTTIAGAGYALTGTTAVTGGTATATFNAAASTGGLTVSAGTLNGTGQVTASGVTNWSGGTMSGTGETRATGGLQMSGINQKTLNQRLLTNTGAATWSGTGNIAGSNGSVISNEGTFDAQTPAQLFISGGGTTAFNNLGTFIKSVAGTTTSFNAGTFNNSGILDVQSGVLLLGGAGGSSTGNFAVDAGATLQFGGTTALASGAFSGAGTVQFTAGTTTIAGAGYALTGTTAVTGGTATATFNGAASTGGLTVSGGTLNGTGQVTVTGLTTWSGGTMSGTGETRATGGLQMSGINQKTLNQRLLTNTGAATWSGTGNIAGGNGSVISNEGTFDAQTPAQLFISGGGTAAFNNLGTFTKSVTGTTTSFNAGTFNNAGILDVQAGTTLVITNLTNFSGTTLTGGTYLIRGTLRFNGANVVTNAATIELDGAASSLLNNTTSANGLANFATNAAAGNFTIQNGRNLTTPAFSNAGSVTVGAGSTLSTAAGNYTQTGGTTTVLVTGTLDPAGIVAIQGGILNGAGTVASNTTNSGQVNPGTSPGILTVNGNYTQNPAGALNIELNGTTAGSGYDRLAVNGTVALGGALNVTRNFASVPGDSFLILDNDGSDAITGNFTGLSDGGIFLVSGRRFQITYTGNDGNDVVLTQLNTAPTLAAIGNKTVDELTPLTFTAAGSDLDMPPQSLTYTLDAGAPAGASIDPTTGVFTWTPTEAQGPGVYTITVRVTDNGSPNLSAFETIAVTVNEVNVDPFLDPIGNKTVDEETLLSFTVTASDPDIPANSLTFTLDPGAPAGATIDPVSGLFTWTPEEVDGPGIYGVTVRVTDNGVPSLSHTRSFSITVNEVNVAPVLAAIGNQSIDEGNQLSFTASATDADLPANGLTFSLINAPTGAVIDPGSGVFTWTPSEAQGPGDFTFRVRVTDNGSPALFDEEEITVSVAEVNVAPELAAIGNRSIDEGNTLSFTATATDADLPANTLTFNLDPGAPAGATIDPLTGVFSWTPSEAQGPGDYSVTIRVTDNGSPSLDDSESITISVGEVNVAPVLAAIGNQSGSEGNPLSFTASATDTDIPANGLTFSLLGAPTGASIDPITGVFSWTPAEDQGPGSYDVTVRVSDDGSPALFDEETITITVAEVNQAPELASIGNRSVNEGDTLSFTAAATDNDIPANSLTFSLDAGAPVGASIDPTTGEFSWTPSEAQGPGSFSVTIRVTDNGSPSLDDAETIVITVGEVNEPPVLAPISDAAVDEGQTLSFTASATDLDVPANNLTFSLDAGSPAGASIDPTTGVFSWTPSEAQGPGDYSVTIRVTDNGSPSLNDAETILITVGEVNVAPVLAPIGNRSVSEGNPLSFTAAATDTDIPANGLTFSLLGAPTGASIDPITGVFSWTPAEDQGPGSYDVTVRVSDDGSPALFDEETITITVAEVNQAPILAAIGNRSVNQGGTLAFTATATDADLPANGLNFSLDAGAPAGASIDPVSGLFSWTPSNAQASGSYSVTIRVTDNGSPSLDDAETIVITVGEVNEPPVLAPISDAAVDEGQTLSFTASATDPDVPANTLTFSLDPGAPAGATIDASTGAFSWTPTEAQGPGSYSITVRVTDNGTPSLSDTRTFTVAVGEVNAAPELASIGNRLVDEGQTLSFTATATDSDLPANSLTFSLLGAPAGASIDPISGIFSWTPTEAQGPASYTVTVRVTDNGSPTLFDEETITISVAEVNQAPVLASVGNRSVNQGSTLSFTATATDADLPANSLTFSLDAGAPAGATINPSTGGFTWTPSGAQGAGDYTVTIRVTDNGSPSLDDSETITITVVSVNAAPTDIALDNASVAENSPAGTVVGALSTTDPDSGDSHSYLLVNNAGGRFQIVGNEVRVAGPLDFETSASHTIRVRSTDAGGLPFEKDFVITVLDVNETGGPTATVTGPAGGVRGQTLTFTLGADQPGFPAGTAFSYYIDWEGDGIVDETISGPDGTLAGHVYTGSGSYSLHLTAVGPDGAVSPQAVHAVEIVALAVQADPLHPGKTLLVVGGSVGDDVIHVGPGSLPGTIKVRINEKDFCVKLRETFQPPIDRIVVYAQAGDDNIQMAGDIDIPAWLYGGAGNDRIKGGGGDNILLGEEGDDTLLGGGGRDVLIGGHGADRIGGQGDDDLLIAGTTAFDPNDVALAAVMAEWTSQRDYLIRVANLKGIGSGARLNGDYFLCADGLTATVFDDGRRDQLTGGAGLDWFFANVTGGGELDCITDLRRKEVATDLSVIG